MYYPITEGALRWLEVILSERFGFSWIIAQENDDLVVNLLGEEGALRFTRLEKSLTTASSDLSYTEWDAESEGWHSVVGGMVPAPGVSDLHVPLINKLGNEYIIGYDILGLTYWMLTRVEEIDRKDVDVHERFPATSSHALKHDYLGRPVVDEWLHLLGQVIQRQWPQIELKQHQFNIKVTHDVDRPSLYAFKPWKNIARTITSQLIKQRNIKDLFTTLYIKLASGDTLLPSDPYNTFDWIMDVSEKNNLRSAFYFICGRTHFVRDADYEIEDRIIRKLMRSIYGRGHEIGLHPSYNTYLNAGALKSEANTLKSICADEGIEQEKWGGRMHYLRWSQPATLHALADSEMDYDATLGYADHPGFRCGTCYEYPAFDPVTQVQLNLMIRPLIVMEGTIIDHTYLGLGYSKKTIDVMKYYRRVCKRVDGTFTLLWLNSVLMNDMAKEIYLDIISDY